MNDISLQNTMNVVAGWLSEGTIASDFEASSASQHLRKFDLSLEDPVTESLKKQYQDAHARYCDLKAHYGDDNDPMVTIAKDMMESAYSALETRQIEKRHRVERKTSLLERLNGESFEIMTKMSRVAQRKKDALSLYFQQQKAEKDAKKRADNNFFLLWMMFELIESILNSAKQNLSLAAQFAEASVIYDAKKKQKISS